MREKGPQRTTGINSQYSMDKCGFEAKEQGGWSVGGKVLRGNIRGKGGVWLNQVDRTLAEGRPA